LKATEEIFFVESHEIDVRLDLLLARRFAQSRSSIQRLIEKGLVLVNGRQLKKRDKLDEGDEVEVGFPLPETTDLVAENIPLDILFEDSYLIVLNKPAGLVVHPGAGNWTGTLVQGLLYHCQNLPQTESLRPGIVHRLDKDTSGVMVAAKTEETHAGLVEAFSKREVEKQYIAIVHGNPGQKLIQAPIGRDPKNRQKMAVVKGGKEAETRIETLVVQEAYSLVRAYPKTGRTHQIRVHLKHLGFPVVHDALYGKASETGRQLLHAEKLTFTHPITKERLSFSAPLPDDFFIS